MNTLREELAAIQHTIWAHWMKHLFSVSVHNHDGSYTIPAEKVKRWTQQMKTPYEELKDAEKESDREQADRILDALKYNSDNSP